MQVHRWLPLISVSTTLLVVLGLWLAAAGYLVHKSKQYTSSLEAIEPRIARLDGALSQQEAIRGALDRQREALEEVVHVSVSDTSQLGAEVLQRTRDAVANTGARVAGSQVRVAKPEGEQSWGEVTVTLSLESGVPELIAAMDALRELRPIVYPTDARMRQSGRRHEGDEQILATELTLKAVYLAQPVGRAQTGEGS